MQTRSRSAPPPPPAPSGGRTFIVYPLRESSSSETMQDLKDAEQEFELLTTTKAFGEHK